MPNVVLAPDSANGRAGGQMVIPDTESSVKLVTSRRLPFAATANASGDSSPAVEDVRAGAGGNGIDGHGGLLGSLSSRTIRCRVAQTIG
jgi:hypothetical protein